MNKTTTIMLVLVVIAAVIRLGNLHTLPQGFYSDESLNGYEAYSILKTGRDQYGTFLPINFQGFGDYRPGLNIYTTVPSVALFGLNEFAVRLPSALMSTATVAVVFLLTKRLFASTAAAAAAAGLFAISPWSIQFARMSHETNHATFLVSAAILSFLVGLQRRRFLIVSFVLFGLSLYAYHSARVFVPLFVPFLLVLYRKQLHKHTRATVAGIAAAVIVVIPLAVSLITVGGLSRVSSLSFWNDPGITARTIEFRHEGVIAQDAFSRVFHNKATETLWQFGANYLTHLEPQFLLFSGDPIEIYHTPGTGLLLLAEPILVLVAGYYIWQKHNRACGLLLVWVGIAILPSALTRFAPASARMHIMLPAISILGGVGLYRFFVWSKTAAWRKAVFIGMFAVLFASSARFFHAYAVHMPIRYARQWHTGVDQVVTKAQKVYDQYETIVVSPSAWGWANFLFYLQYPPKAAQQEIVLGEANEFGFGWVDAFGKYRFETIPGAFDFEKNILYIGKPNEFPNGTQPIDVVYFPDGTEAFYFANTHNIYDACPGCGIKRSMQ